MDRLLKHFSLNHQNWISGHLAEGSFSPSSLFFRTRIWVIMGGATNPMQRLESMYINWLIKFPTLKGCLRVSCVGPTLNVQRPFRSWNHFFPQRNWIHKAEQVKTTVTHKRCLLPAPPDPAPFSSFLHFKCGRERKRDFYKNSILPCKRFWC